MEDVNFRKEQQLQMKGTKFQMEKEMRARRKKANIGEEEARMEIAGCTGKKHAERSLDQTISEQYRIVTK